MSLPFSKTSDASSTAASARIAADPDGLDPELYGPPGSAKRALLNPPDPVVAAAYGLVLLPREAIAELRGIAKALHQYALSGTVEYSDVLQIQRWLERWAPLKKESKALQEWLDRRALLEKEEL